MSVKVKIKILPGGKMPEKKTKGAAAYDCYASENVTVNKTPTLIGLGFALELPEGYHAEIVPRSSIGLNTYLRQPNCIGIIDSDYRGEVKAMYECQPHNHNIKVGDRIAQMLIKKNIDVEMVEVEDLSQTERGDGGFGSTGTR